MIEQASRKRFFFLRTALRPFRMPELNSSGMSVVFCTGMPIDHFSGRIQIFLNPRPSQRLKDQKLTVFYPCNNNNNNNNNNPHKYLQEGFKVQAFKLGTQAQHTKISFTIVKLTFIHATFVFLRQLNFTFNYYQILGLTSESSSINKNTGNKVFSVKNIFRLKYLSKRLSLFHISFFFSFFFDVTKGPRNDERIIAAQKAQVP